MRKTAFLTALLLTALLPVSAYAMAESADCACVMDALTGELIFEKNAYSHHAMASTTKIMTALIALEESEPDEIVTISPNADAQEGSSAYLQAESGVYMKDLLYGLMLNSGNDAAMAIAEHISGGSEQFAYKMTERAAKIGAADTSFKNPSGLDADGHYTTAFDLALITREALRNKDFREITAARTARAETIDGNVLYFKNHNKLLGSYSGCIGVKPGYTKATGRCLVSAAERDGMAFIAVTLGDPNDWTDHTQMLDYAFSKCKPREIISKGQCVKRVTANGKSYAFIAADSFSVNFRLKQAYGYTVENHIIGEMPRAINKGEKVGCCVIYYGDKPIGMVDIISEEDIYASDNMRVGNDFWETLKRIIGKL